MKNDKRDQASMPWYSRPFPCAGIILLAGLVCYANSFGGVFLLDDFGHIVTSQTIRQVGPISKHLSEFRPLVHFSLAVNYAVSELNPWSYHAVNLIVHLLSAVVLFGVARRMLFASRLGEQKERGVVPVAFVIALLWVVHPLQTQSVTYIIQRGESMMGLFYLLTIYCFFHGADVKRSRGWPLGAVASCAAGMMTKEAMVTAPFMVWLCDAVFVSRSWAAPLKRRWPLYLGLLATIGLLAAQGLFSDIFFGSKKHGADIGFQVQGMTPWRYLLTQPEVLLHYLRLCFWPYPQCFDYGWQAVGNWQQAALPGLVILAMLAVAGVLLWKRPAIGFLGAWWFVILAPTSSIVPIKDFAFEQRMYLPLAAVIAAVVLGVRWTARTWITRHGRDARFAGRAMAVLLIVTTAALGVRTLRRNADYSNAVTIWADVVAQRPNHLRAWNHYGVALTVDGRYEEAIHAYQAALKLDPSLEEVHTNLGKALSKACRYAEAVLQYEESLKYAPDDSMIHHSLAIALERCGRIDEALAEYRKTLTLQPDHPYARFNMGLAFKSAGRWEDAANAFFEAGQFDPTDAAIFYQLGDSLARCGRREEAVSALRTAVKLNPKHADANNLLQALQYVR